MAAVDVLHEERDGGLGDVVAVVHQPVEERFRVAGGEHHRVVRTHGFLKQDVDARIGRRRGPGIRRRAGRSPLAVSEVEIVRATGRRGATLPSALVIEREGGIRRLPDLLEEHVGAHPQLWHGRDRQDPGEVLGGPLIEDLHVRLHRPVLLNGEDDVLARLIDGHSVTEEAAASEGRCRSERVGRGGEGEGAEANPDAVHGYNPPESPRVVARRVPPVNC